jgi:chromosome segregation ATPase
MSLPIERLLDRISTQLTGLSADLRDTNSSVKDLDSKLDLMALKTAVMEVESKTLRRDLENSERGLRERIESTRTLAINVEKAQQAHNAHVMMPSNSVGSTSQNIDVLPILNSRKPGLMAAVFTVLSAVAGGLYTLFENISHKK